MHNNAAAVGFATAIVADEHGVSFNVNDSTRVVVDPETLTHFMAPSTLAQVLARHLTEGRAIAVRGRKIEDGIIEAREAVIL